MTKSTFYILVSIFVLFLIESAAIKVVAPDVLLVPQLLLLAVVSLALDKELNLIIWLAFVSGVFLEVFSGYYFGSYIFALSACGLLTYALTRKVTTRDITVPTALFLVALNTIFFIFMVVIYTEVLSFFGLGSGIAVKALFSAKLIWTVILNLLFFYPVKIVIKFVSKTDEPGNTTLI